MKVGNLLASETPGPLPERQQDLAQATALWLAGHSKREACRLTGVPRTTLSVSLDKAGLTERDRAKYLDVVEDLAVRAAEEAGRQLLERLEGDTALTPMQLATVFGICSDKLTAVRRLKTAPDTADGGLSRLAERLAGLSHASVTMQVEPARVIEARTVREG